MGEKILVIGCGGLGCELVKILAQDPGNTLTLVDDDTIDPTNLNRQFLFTREDIGKSKSETVARKVVSLVKTVSPGARVSGIFGSIVRFPHIGFYKRFSVVYSCLDNAETRSFVNQRCSAAGVPMVDGGSAGWLGQSFFNGEECFDCLPKRQERVYPVCSVRQRPKDFEHCLVWARDVVGSGDVENLRNEIVEHAKSDIGQEPESLSCRKPAIDQDDGAAVIQNSRLLDQELSDSSVELLESESSSRSISPDDMSPDKSISKIPEAAVDPVYPVLSISELETEFESCKDKMRLIYSIALLKASRFGIEPFSFTDSQTFVRKIVPSICTTNSIVASLMVLSRTNKKNYYLVHGSLGIAKTGLNRKRSDCLTCSLPVYRCNFPVQTSVSDFFTLFKAESLLDEVSFYEQRLGEELQILDGRFAVAIKNGFRYRIYFEKHSGKLSVERIK